MNLKKIFPYLIITTFIFACSKKQNQIGVVDLPYLYTSFDYQKELKNRFDFEQNIILQKVDSLDKFIQLVEIELKNSSEYNEHDKNILFEREYKNYLIEKEYFAYKTDSLSKDFTEKIWKQINSYVEDFGNENEYDVIIGTQGDGNVMYVKESSDITNEVIEYINKKYNGE